MRDGFPDDYWGGAGSVGGVLDLEAADGMLGFGWHKVAGFGCGVPAAEMMESVEMRGMNYRDLTSAVFQRFARDPPDGVEVDDHQDVVKTVSSDPKIRKKYRIGAGIPSSGAGAGASGEV